MGPCRHGSVEAVTLGARRGEALPHEFSELLVMRDGVRGDRIEVERLSGDFSLKTVERGSIFRDFLSDRGDDLFALDIIIDDGREKFPRGMGKRRSRDGWRRYLKVQERNEMVTTISRVIQERSF